MHLSMLFYIVGHSSYRRNKRLSAPDGDVKSQNRFQIYGSSRFYFSDLTHFYSRRNSRL
jgi:hypothetical protein